MKTLIITHIDMDGSGVAIMFKKIRPDADIIHVNYGWEEDAENIRKIDQYDELLIGDISFSPKFAEILNKSNKSVVLYDHHDSAIRSFKEAGTIYDWMTLDVNACGTLLVYQAIKSQHPEFDPDDHYKELAVLIDDYDRWEHKDPRSISLQFLWHGLEADKFEEKFINNPELLLTPDELQIIKVSSDELNESINVARASMNPEDYIDCDGYKFNYCSDVPHLASLVAMYIQRDNPQLDYLILNSGYGSISFRSTRIKVNRIAESLGGGGHDLAAGAPIDFKVDVVNSVINRKLIQYEFYNKFNKESDKVEKIDS